MKAWLHVLMVFSTSFLFAQGSLMVNSFDWNKWERKLSPEEQTRTLDRLFENPDMIPLFLRDQFSKESNLDSYHFLDVNNDSLIDIIYNGPTGTGNGVILFLNIGSTYETTNTIAGRIIGMERSDLSELIMLKILRSSSEENYRSFVQLSIKPNDVKLLTSAEYSYKTNTELPVSYFPTKPFLVKREFYNLRSQPKIERASEEWSEIIEGNVVAIYPQGSVGKAIGESVDEKGRKWWFVIMENNIQPTKSLLVYKKPTNMSMGWMSARFLEEIKP